MMHTLLVAGKCLAQVLLRQLRSKRVIVLALGHAGVFVLTYWLAFALRFDFQVPPSMVGLYWWTLPWLLGVKLGVFYWLRSFHGWWRYVTFGDLTGLLRASAISTLAIMALERLFMPNIAVPRTVLVLDLAITILILGGMRGSLRAFRERCWPMISGNRRTHHHRAVIIGTDYSSEGLARLIQTNPSLPYRIVGFLDPDTMHLGSRVGGLPVLGGPDDLERIARACGIKYVLVVVGSLSGERVRKVMDACQRFNLKIRMIPGVRELLDGSSGGPYLRKVDIQDLLRRDPVVLDSVAIGSVIEGRSIMISGAGGSIGCEMCRQVLSFKPGCLILVERAENNLFSIERELNTLPTRTLLKPCIADICDRKRMVQILERYKPDVIFHAAAYKHVPMMEHNCGEAIKNNVFGTKRLADLAHRHGVSRFVMISTDKAVRPSSVMGVTKLIAEQYVHALAQVSATKFMVVRFGNVLGSAGSVVPIFQEQIRRGGPVTITHPDMRRYFMTIPEASQLVLQAAAMGKGGEIFVLDMGEPVKIVDLAHDLIRLLGLSPEDIEIVFTGLRPGEKLYEELHMDEEEILTSPHPKLLLAAPRPNSRKKIYRSLVKLRKIIHEPDDVIRTLVQELVPEYRGTSIRHPCVLEPLTPNS